MNVLVVGMPNVGKSTLLNALRNIGIAGRKFIFTCAMRLPHADILPHASNAESAPDVCAARHDAGALDAPEVVRRPPGLRV